MTYEISKKKSMHISMYNFWYYIRISLFILVFILATAITLCVLGVHKNIHMMRCSLVLFIATGLYLLHLLFIFVSMLIKIWKQNRSYDIKGLRKWGASFSI